MDAITKHSGVHYLWRGFQLIRHPDIRRYVVMPIALNCLVFVALWWLGGHFMAEFNAWVVSQVPNWLQWLSDVLWAIFVVVGLIATAYLFAIVSNIIGGAFYGQIAEAVQVVEFNHEVPQMSVWQALCETPAAIGRSLKFLGYMLPRLILMLIITLLPVLNMISGVLWFMFGAWMQALQYVDYPMDMNHKTFRYSVKFMHERPFPCMGFGSLVMLLMMVPIVNIFVMPAAVAGATVFYGVYHDNQSTHA